MTADKVSLASYDHQMWVETLLVFKRTFRKWLPWGLVWSVLTLGVAAVNRGLSIDSQTEVVKQSLQNKDLSVLSFAVLTPIALYGLVALGLGIVRSYSFLAFYLRENVSFAGLESFSAQRLGRWVGAMTLMVLATLIPLVPVLGVTGVLGFLSQGEGLVGAGGAAVAFLAFLGVLAMIFVVVRLTLVSPLSAARFPKALRTSWALTQGSFWRLFGNALLLGLAGLAGMLVLVGVAFGLGFVLPEKAAEFVTLLLGVPLEVIFTSLDAAFVVVALDRFGTAKKARDPSFALTPLT